MYRQTAKIVLISNKAMKEQSVHFICITYRGKHNRSVLNNVWSSWSEHKFFPIQNVWATQQISPKIVLNFDCGNEENNLHVSRIQSIMSLYFQCTKLIPPSNLDQTTTVTLSAPRVNQ